MLRPVNFCRELFGLMMPICKVVNISRVGIASIAPRIKNWTSFLKSTMSYRIVTKVFDVTVQVQQGLSFSNVATLLRLPFFLIITIII
jgi:hypothetical protein